MALSRAGAVVVSGAVLAVGCLAGGCGAEHAPTVLRTSAKSAAPPTRCAKRALSDRIPANSWSLARRELAPPGASGIGLCRYSGLDEHPQLALIRSVVLDAPSLVGELVREFDELGSLEGGTYSCPSENGSEIDVLLAYASGHGVAIAVDLSGCLGVRNGDVDRTTYGVGSRPTVGPHLLRQLEQLTARAA